MMDKTLVFRNPEDVINAVETYGIVPFFRNRISGFSIEEHTPSDLWFTEFPGPWEWKGAILRGSNCYYGKFFENRAAYVSADLFPDLANFRRDGYDYDARMEDGLGDEQDFAILQMLSNYEGILSRALKKKTGYFGKEGKSGFESRITRLQMQGYVTIQDFEYDLDKHGKPYGWGVARYTTPENSRGPAFTDRVYLRKPEESYAILLAKLKSIFPEESDQTIARFLNYKDRHLKKSPAGRILL
ncbi:MAG: hypothetical protein IKF46_00100 [Erysipelotrichaceae bacterium]|nr:hypothetical protein [Erysipelotrichaceae bacterium]